MFKRFAYMSGTLLHAKLNASVIKNSVKTIRFMYFWTCLSCWRQVCDNKLVKEVFHDREWSFWVLVSEACALEYCVWSVGISVDSSHVSTYEKALWMIWTRGVDIEYGVSFGVHSEGADNLDDHLIFTGVSDISLDCKWSVLDFLYFLKSKTSWICSLKTFFVKSLNGRVDVALIWR